MSERLWQGWIAVQFVLLAGFESPSSKVPTAAPPLGQPTTAYLKWMVGRVCTVVGGTFESESDEKY